MTKKQAVAEMKYRLAKYVLQVLLDAELINTEEAIKIYKELTENREKY